MTKKSPPAAVPQPTDGKLAAFYVPFPNLKEATKAARTLIGAELVVCANIIPGVLSIFADSGGIEEQPEAIVIFKTSPSLVTTFTATLSELHPYDTPAIIELTVAGVNHLYSTWANRQLNLT